ncbi:MAG TPA: hypothetical protein DC054_22860 [Blastocatellia bacterium]|nr:hypothetical protein [Blastocatellia bacterium]
MRWKLLPGVSALISVLVLILLNLFHLRIPFGLSPFLIFWVLGPLLMIPLTALNRKLLAWRKQRGRDIEEEERYEIDGTDFISLQRQPSVPTTREQKYTNYFGF